jgi:hypothetical protein
LLKQTIGSSCNTLGREQNKKRVKLIKITTGGFPTKKKPMIEMIESMIQCGLIKDKKIDK